MVGKYYRKLKVILYNNAGIPKKDKISIATKERAFLDTIYLFKNYHFDNLKTMNWNLCTEIAQYYESKSLMKLLRAYNA